MGSCKDTTMSCISKSKIPIRNKSSISNLNIDKNQAFKYIDLAPFAVFSKYIDNQFKPKKKPVQQSSTISKRLQENKNKRKLSKTDTNLDAGDAIKNIETSSFTSVDELDSTEFKQQEIVGIKPTSYDYILTSCFLVTVISLTTVVTQQFSVAYRLFRLLDKFYGPRIYTVFFTTVLIFVIWIFIVASRIK